MEKVTANIRNKGLTKFKQEWLPHLVVSKYVE